MTEEQRERLVEQARKGEEAAMAVVGPSSGAECLCESCGGVVVTVVFGGRDRPEFGFRLGSKGRRPIRLHDEGGGDAAPRSLRCEVCCGGQRTVSGCPKISFICGGCGRRLFLFEGGAHD